MKNLKQQDLNYSRYIMSTKELLIYGAEGLALLSLFGYFFYRSFLITIMGIPLIYIYIVWKSKELKESRKFNLRLQFKEALVSVAGSLQAGYSLENSFFEAYKEMASFYGTNSLIARELRIIEQGVNNGRPLVQMLMDFGKRSEVDDIAEFASVLVIGKRTGGNLLEIMYSFISVMEEKISVVEEIKTMVSAKRFEQKIMNCVPFFIIFYIELTSPGFFNSLYHNLIGQVIMTFCLVMYLLSIHMSGKIMQIEI